MLDNFVFDELFSNPKEKAAIPSVNRRFFRLPKDTAFGNCMVIIIRITLENVGRALMFWAFALMFSLSTGFKQNLVI